MESSTIARRANVLLLGGLNTQICDHLIVKLAVVSLLHLQQHSFGIISKRYTLQILSATCVCSAYTGRSLQFMSIVEPPIPHVQLLMAL